MQDTTSEDDLITIVRNIKPMEIAMFKDMLESEGIECFLKDEYIYYTKYVTGGVKLQVKNKDVEKAIEILKGIGYIVGDEAEEEMTFFKWLAKPTEYFPVIRHLSIEKRLAIVGVSIAIIVALILYVLFYKPPQVTPYYR